MKNARICAMLFLLGCTALAQAQTNTNPPVDPFEQLLRRMDQQMSKGLPPDSLSGGGGSFFSSPDSSFFYFKMDTLLQGDGMQLFNTDPFGNSAPQGFSNIQQLFDQLSQMMEHGQMNQGGFPSDDGENPQELLPEERLRQQEKDGTTPPQPTPPPVAKSKHATVRI